MIGSFSVLQLDQLMHLLHTGIDLIIDQNIIIGIDPNTFLCCAVKSRCLLIYSLSYTGTQTMV